MEVSVVNSIILENIQNVGDSRTSKRIFSNSDLELDYIHINEKNIEEQKDNSINQGNNDINNQNNQNNNDDEEQEEDNNISNNSANDNNNNANNNANNNNNNNIPNNNPNNLLINLFLDILDDEILNNDNVVKQKKAHNDLIKELRNKNLIFLKDYSNQKTDKGNISYVSWLKKIRGHFFHIKLNNTKNNNIENRLIFNQRIEIPDYEILKNEIEKKLFFCFNPQCNCIVYMDKKQKEKLKEIQDLIYNEDLEDIGNYKKDRCPLCLKYKCIYCQKTSTLLNANCCIKQLLIACSTSIPSYGVDYCIFKFALFSPIIRVFYMACMVNFGFFRGLTLEKNLLQSKQFITRMIEQNINSNIIFGTYQAKFSRISMFIISLLNILGSICWALPFILYIEIILIVSMFIGFCTKNKFFRRILYYFYLLAFIPGLRRGVHGRFK